MSSAFLGLYHKLAFEQMWAILRLVLTGRASQMAPDSFLFLTVDFRNAWRLGVNPTPSKVYAEFLSFCVKQITDKKKKNPQISIIPAANNLCCTRFFRNHLSYATISIIKYNVACVGKTVNNDKYAAPVSNE